MTVLSTIPNGASNKDIRDTINQILADVAGLKAGIGVVTPTPTPAPTPTMGVTLVGGQSLMTRMFRPTTDATTIAALGLTIDPANKIFATYEDPNETNYTPDASALTYQPSSDTGTYKSAGAVAYLNLMKKFSGRPWALVGAPVGATSISQWQPGTPNLNKLLAVLAASGGRADEVMWMLGHNDATGATSYASFKSQLGATMAAIAAASSVVPRFRIATVPYLSVDWGGNASVNTIRRAAADWCAANGATYMEPQDFGVLDGLHESQAGAVIIGTHYARAARPSLGLTGGDTGPVLSSVTRANGKVVCNFTLPTGATSLVQTGTGAATRLRAYAAGTITPAIAIGTLTVGATTISFNDPDITKAYDLYVDFDTATGVMDGAANALRDNHIEADEAAAGITFGRVVRPTLLPVTVAAGQAPAPASVSARYIRVVVDKIIASGAETFPLIWDGIGIYKADGSAVAASWTGPGADANDHTQRNAIPELGDANNATTYTSPPIYEIGSIDLRGDLGALYNVTQIGVTPNQANRGIGKAEVYYSATPFNADGSGGTLAFTDNESDQGAWSNDIERRFAFVQS